MTVNGLISIIYVVGAIVLFFLALAMIWRARTYLFERPVAAWVALGGWVFSQALFVGHLSILRAGAPPNILETNGYGTLAIRGIWLFITLAVLRRFLSGRFLSPNDLARLRGEK